MIHFSVSENIVIDRVSVHKTSDLVTFCLTKRAALKTPIVHNSVEQIHLRLKYQPTPPRD